MSTEKSISILIVEDNPVDSELALEALQHGKLSNDVNLVTDGGEAMRYLRKESPYENVTRPDLVLLDLNLPKLDGREVLRQIRENEDLKLIPVVILTISGTHKDIVQSYGLQANSYIVKPVSVNSLFEVVRSINNFWLRIVSLPPETQSQRRDSQRRLDGSSSE